MPPFRMEKVSFFAGRRSSFNVALHTKYQEYGSERRIAYSVSMVVWLVVLGFCIFWTYEVLSTGIKNLISPPISTQTRLINNQSLVYPAVTLCYKNEDNQPYKLEVLQHLGLSDYWKSTAGSYITYSNESWKGFQWGKTSLSQLWNLATYHAHIADFKNLESGMATSDEYSDDMTIMVSLNNDPSAVSTSYGYFYEHGRCYTFRPKEGKEPPPGSQYGYKFVVNYRFRPLHPFNETNHEHVHSHEHDHVLNKNHVTGHNHNHEHGHDKHMLKVGGRGESTQIFDPQHSTFKNRGGWDIFVHDPLDSWSENEPLTDSHHEHFFVQEGRKAEIKLGQSTYCTTNTSSDPCGQGRQTQCKEHCRWRRLMKSFNINCSLPFVYPMSLGLLDIPECSSYSDTMALMYHYRDWVRYTAECSKECIRNCNGRLFSGQLLRSEVLTGREEKSAFIDIFFPSGMYMSLSEENAYTMEMFIADLGGIYGFALGISVITVLEFFDWVLFKICLFWSERSICRRKKKKAVAEKGIYKNVDCLSVIVVNDKDLLV